MKQSLKEVYAEIENGNYLPQGLKLEFQSGNLKSQMKKQCAKTIIQEQKENAKWEFHSAVANSELEIGMTEKYFHNQTKNI